MIGGVKRMAVRNFRVMRSFLVIPILGVFRSVAVMLRRLFVMARGMLVMFVNIVMFHRILRCVQIAQEFPQAPLSPCDNCEAAV